MREILFFLIAASFVVLIDLYAFQALKTAFPLSSSLGKLFACIFWSFTIYLIVAIIVTATFGLGNIPAPIRKLTGAIFFFGLLSKTFAIVLLFGEDIYRGLAYGFEKIFFPGKGVVFANRRKFLSQFAIFSAFVPLVVLTYGVLRNAYNYKFHKVKLSFNNLPESFKGFKIIQLSDIHAGSFTQTRPIEKVVEKINAMNPDLILFTGDLVNDLATEMDQYKDIFSKLKAKHGVFSILGNHDYGDYAFGREASPEKEANFLAFLKVHKDMGWDLLRNEHRIIEKNGEQIALLGVENFSAKGRFATHGDLKKTSVSVPNDLFQILMSHDPSHWDFEVNKDYPQIDITLSGHTHGFQFGIETKWFKWSPAQYMYKQWAGLYQRDAQYIYVNRGFGNLGYPGRIGILPEVTVLELV
jgi:hypothetical protein